MPTARTARRTLLVNRPADEVFTFFTTPANDPRWRQHVTKISADGQLAVGTRVHQVVAGPMGRSINADIVVTDYEPPTAYGFEVVAGPVRPIGRFEFRPEGNGTEVTFSLHAEVRGIWQLLMARPVQKTMDDEMASLDTAKALLERG